MRQNFSVGQEIISQDLNTLQSRLERGIYDRLLYQLMGRKTNAFFQDSLKVVYQTGTDVTIKAGVGFQSIDTGTSNPVKKPLAVDADLSVSIDTPDPTNPRIDIIYARHGRYNSEAENRKFKDEFSDTITTQATTISTDWKAEVLYLAGTPAGSPVAPATPSGYIKLADVYVTALTGIANQAAITDSRDLLPFAISTNSTGSSEYDAIVGIIGTDQGASYSTLKDALDAASDGWKILVLRSETINTIPVILNNKVEVVFKRGVTFTKGTAVKGLQVNGNDCKVSGFRASGFSTAGDYGLHVNAGALRSVIDSPRFLSCDTNVEDDGTDTFINVEFTE